MLKKENARKQYLGFYSNRLCNKQIWLIPILKF